MKKYSFILAGLALALALAVGSELYGMKRTAAAFNQAKHRQVAASLEPAQAVFVSMGSGFVLDKEQIAILQDKAKGDKEQALAQITEKTLLELHHKDWLKDTGLESNFLFGNVYKDAKDEFVLTVNRGKDLAMLFVFTEKEKGYGLVSRLRGLVPITDLRLVGVPGFPYRGLMVEECLDEMTGGFFMSHGTSIYLFKDERLNKVWERSNYLREYYPQGGQLKGAETQWWMNTEEVEIDITDKGQIKVTGARKEEKSQTLGSMEGPYELLFEQRVEENYLWSPKDLQYKLVK